MLLFLNMSSHLITDIGIILSASSFMLLQKLKSILMIIQGIE